MSSRSKIGTSDHHAGLLGEVDHPGDGWPVGDRLGRFEVLILLSVAEVRSVEDLLEAQNLSALYGSVSGEVDVLVDHRVYVTGPCTLDERSPHRIRHAIPPGADQYRPDYQGGFTFRKGLADDIGQPAMVIARFACGGR